MYRSRTFRVRGALLMLFSLGLSACHSWRSVTGLEAISPDTERVRLRTALRFSPVLELENNFTIRGDTLVAPPPSATRVPVWDVLAVEERKFDGSRTLLLAAGLTVAFFHLRVFLSRGVCVGSLTGYCRDASPGR